MTRVTTAFVTGVDGQDGYYLAQRLLADGATVHALSHSASSTTDQTSPDGLTMHRGDLCDLDGMRAFLHEIAPDQIYNLAALSSVAQSWRQPDLVAAVNGQAAVGLLQSAWQLQESTGRQVRFVQASSAEIFGRPAGSPQTERTPVAPVNPYGAAKAYAHLAVGVWRGRGLHASSAILYNHESPRRDPRFVTRKISSTVAAIVRGEVSELVLGNLEARRDWGWAPDYVDALVRAAGAASPSDYVIATGQAHSVREFVAAAFDHAGVPDWAALVRSDPRFERPVEAVDQVGDASHARSSLGWSPTVSFEQVVGRMVDADLRLGR